MIAVLRGAAGIALVRLSTAGAPRWTRPGACAGEAAVLAVGGDLAVCAVRTASGSGPVAAYSAQTGALLWTRELVAETVQVEGALVLVRGADRATVLRADGQELASFASGTGGPVAAALVSSGGAVLLVSVERGAVVARWPQAAMVPLWSVAVDGEVTELTPLADHVLVALAQGEAYTLRALDGATAAIPAEAERFFATGDGVLAVTAGRGSSPGRLAWFSVDGALRWEYDVALPGRLQVLPGATAVAFGEMLDQVLELSGDGLGRRLVLPESAASAAWLRMQGGAARWVGVSTSDARWWVR